MAVHTVNMKPNYVFEETVNVVIDVQIMTVTSGTFIWHGDFFIHKLVGARGLEPLKTLVGRFTVSCNCRYAIRPKLVLQSGLEPLYNANQAKGLHYLTGGN